EDGRVHIQHVSAKESVVAIEQAKAAGVQITAEVSPHHLTLTDEAVKSLDANFKMNPPLRAESDRHALIEGLRSGAIDCVATDHAPHSSDEKEVPVEEAAFGVIGLETAFAVSYTHLVKAKVIKLPRLIDLLSCGPARVFKLPGGSLHAGSLGDVTLLDVDAKWDVPRDFQPKAFNSPFIGQTLQGRVVATVVAGEIRYQQQPHHERSKAQARRHRR
ncbi:MAG TPA: amidohydrolase family protein, partial [Vicinamibacterales bacterium]|nr:amidohydrolase family protein [Vicinamibacterales bacterium]